MKRTKVAYDKLCDLQMKTLMTPSRNGMEEEACMFAKWQHLAELEEKFLHQKSKLHSLKVGDGNNRYFHQAAKIRKAINSIREVQRSDGTISVTQEEIKIEA